MRKLVAILGLVVPLTLAGTWFRPGPARGFATPTACVEAYCRAVKDGDAAGYLECLSELGRRGQPEPATLASELRARGRDLRGWAVVAAEPAADGQVLLTVDEQLSAGRRRRRLVLAKEGKSWRVARAEAARDLEPGIPYGTHVRDMK